MKIEFKEGIIKTYIRTVLEMYKNNYDYDGDYDCYCDWNEDWDWALALRITRLICTYTGLSGSGTRMFIWRLLDCSGIYICIHDSWRQKVRLKQQEQRNKRINMQENNHFTCAAQRIHLKQIK